MFKKVGWFAVVLFIISCSKDGSKTLILGQLDKFGSGMVYLKEISVKGIGATDSFLTNSNGDFKFIKHLKNPEFYLLYTKNQKPLTVIAQPGDRIKITGAADSLFFHFRVKGSEETERAQIINLMLNRTMNILDSLNTVYHQFINNPNIAQIKQTLTYNCNRAIDEQRDFTIMFIKKDPASLANLIALYQEVDPETKTYVLYKDEDIQVFNKVDSFLFRKFPNCSQVQAMHDNVQNMRLQQNQIKMKHMLSAMGKPAPEVAMATPRGDTARLSNFKGKYVLLDFWASWCTPCREENPNLVAIYQKYHKFGFEIFQVSLDKTRDAWTKAIVNDKLNWVHVCDYQMWQSPAAQTYHVDGIPASFLIDKDGVIIGRNLKGESLDDRLKAIFDTN